MAGDVMLAKRCPGIEGGFGQYDVFISHRGPDTKRDFVSFLNNELKRAGLEPFLDHECIHKGENSWTCIEHAIKTTPIALVIFSKDFFESEWCLKELQLILDSPGIKVLPVFYEVQPGEVRVPENGQLGAAFEKLKQKHNESDLRQWKENLRATSEVNGWEYSAADNRLKSDLVNSIVGKVFDLANKTLPMDVGNHVFGIDEVAHEIIQKLDGKKKALMLWGMGGIGKSTLARMLFNALCAQYTASCFIEDVKDKVKQPGGREVIQNCILNGLCPNDSKKIMNKSEGKSILEKRLCKKRILLVLDDVHDGDDMEFWISQKMLGEGSLCIVTSRDKCVLMRSNALRNDEVHIHEVVELNNVDSRRVLASYAFGDHEKVQVGFEDLVENISKACGGIPLVLKVCGALLKNEKDVGIWRDVLKKLQSGTMMGEAKIFECLRISYDALRNDELRNDALQNEFQEMFLDVTCALLGKSRALAARAWDSHGWPGALGIRSLVEKALVVVDKNGCLRMHNHLRDMGHEIVRRRRESDGVIRRLWMPESSAFLEGDVERLLESLETLVVFSRSPSLKNDLDISNMKKLRILMCDDSSKVTSAIPRSLCWWDWYGPWFRGLQTKRILPTILPKNNLVFLNLQRSEITIYSDTFGGLVRLEVLNLSNCMKLGLLQESIGDLKMLRDLNLEGTKISCLPESIGRLSNLEVLNLSKCRELHSLPESFGGLNKLRDLNLESSGMLSLPKSFGGLSKLEVLNITACQKLLFLPHSTRCLQNVKDFSYSGSAFDRLLQVVGESDDFEMLKTPSKLMKLPILLEILSTRKQLQLANCKFEVLPESFGDLSNLEVLCLAWCQKLKLLPSSFGGLRKLQDLNLDNSGVRSLPESFGDLSNLEVLNLRCCSDLVLLPKSFGNLKKLGVLNMERSGISSLPESFRDLNNLEVLSLAWCTKLELLPSSFGGLKKLQDLKLDDSGVNILPESFGDLSNLEVLNLRCCSDLVLLPKSFGNLKKLGVLNMERSRISSLPESFGDLTNLEVLNLRCCSNLILLPNSFGGLNKLRDLNLESSRMSSLPKSFGGLSKLEVLNLTACQKLLFLPHSIRCLQNVKNFSYSRSAFERSLLVAGELDDFEMLNIPSKLMKLSNLWEILRTQKQLQLVGFAIEDLPELFGDLSNLEVLSLEGRLDFTLLPSSIGGLRKLWDLELDSFGVTNLPESFGELHNLEVLSLARFRNLELLPISFGSLRKLRHLKLSDLNKVRNLPTSFRDLSNLEVLSLRGCESLTLLPSSFGGLRKLRQLELAYSGVSSLPTFGDLSNLEMLSLKECKNLTLLPSSFGGLKKLWQLELDYSGVSSLPTSFGDLSNLEMLSLKGCKNLTLLPSSFGGLRNLWQLELAYSGISSLPTTFGDLSNLEVLSLESCTSLKLLPKSFGGLRKLRQLILACSGVSSLLDAFGDRNNLEVPDPACYSNLKLLPKLFGGLRRLQDLKLRKSNVSSVPESYRDLDNLEVLSLTGCTHLKLLPSSFGGLRKLRGLQLDRSRVRSLPESFGDLSNLEVLSLKYSNLVLLPESFGCLGKLRALSLRSSAISSLPESFGGLSSLRELDLSRCRSLEALPQSFTQLTNLLKLNLGECPARNSFISLQHLMGADLNLSTMVWNNNGLQEISDGVQKIIDAVH